MLPQFSLVSQLMPTLKQLENNARDNAEKWKTYEETEDFKKVYVKKTPEQRRSVEENEKIKEKSHDSDLVLGI